MAFKKLLAVCFLTTAAQALGATTSTCLLSESASMQQSEIAPYMLAQTRQETESKLPRQEPSDWSWITHEPDQCLKIRSLNYRVDVIQPIGGPQLVIQRATFTVDDTSTCEGKEENYGLYVVFSQPEKINDTYVFTQRTLQWLKADTYEAVIESINWLIPGEYSVQLQIRDIYRGVIIYATDLKTLDIARNS